MNAELDEVEAEINKAASDHGFAHETPVKFGGWQEPLDSKMIALSQQGYKNAGYQNPEFLAVHGGLECGLFSVYHPGISMVSVGPTITGAHTKEETVYLDTVEPTVGVVAYMLENI